MSKAKLLIILLVVFLLGDLTYSFFEYYFTPLDGDISSGNVRQVLDDPFGFNLLFKGEMHVNPNRFFAHFFFIEYVQKVPIWFQRFFNPITSVYLSCALIKIFVHILVIFVLASLISGTKNLFDRKFIIVAALIVPFIQANGYWGHMGINDRATTYTFFYAFPVVLLMIYLSPLYRIVFNQRIGKMSFLMVMFVFGSAIVLPLSGPLIPGIVLIVTGLIGIQYLLKYDFQEKPVSFRSLISAIKNIPVQIFIFLVPISLISLYSLFLGLYNLNYDEATIPLLERYLKLPLGIYYQISQSLGVPLLLIIIGINVYLIKKYFYSSEGQKIVGAIKWIGIFSVIYLLFLPFGGYRPYRPNILRYDTFIPITISLIYFYGLSSYFLISNFKLRAQKIYLIGLFPFFAIYMNADRLKTGQYHCERNALEYLANSTDEIVLLPTDCNVMSWGPITDPKLSEHNANMLKFWGITKEKKLYYHQSIPK